MTVLLEYIDFDILAKYFQYLMLLATYYAGIIGGSLIILIYFAGILL